jgi:hypothetical protein
LGFDWKCLCYYVKDNCKYDFFDFVTIKKSDKDCIYPFEVFEHNHNGKEGYFSVPPVALALKWMMDEKGFDYSIFKERYMPLNNTQGYDAAESALLDELLTILGKEKKK